MESYVCASTERLGASHCRIEAGGGVPKLGHERMTSCPWATAESNLFRLGAQRDVKHDFHARTVSDVASSPSSAGGSFHPRHCCCETSWRRAPSMPGLLVRQRPQPRNGKMTVSSSSSSSSPFLYLGVFWPRCIHKSSYGNHNVTRRNCDGCGARLFGFGGTAKSWSGIFHQI